MKLTLNRVGATVNMQAEGSPEELALYSKLAGLLEADEPEAEPAAEEPVKHRHPGSSLFVTVGSGLGAQGGGGGR